MGRGVRAQRLAADTASLPAPSAPRSRGCRIATCTTAWVSARPMPARRATAGRSAARYPDAIPAATPPISRRGHATREKLALLQAMFRRLDAQGVALVALQEVFEVPRPCARSCRRLVGGHDARACPARRRSRSTSASRGDAACAVRDVAAVNTLADSGLPDRPLRPGLAFTVDVGGQARARARRAPEGRLPQPRPRRAAHREGREAAGRAAGRGRVRLRAACATSCRRWKTGSTPTRARDFALLGDFNRTLLREPPADSRDVPHARSTAARLRSRWDRARSTRDGKRVSRRLRRAHARDVSRAQRRRSAGRGAVARALRRRGTRGRPFRKARRATAASSGRTASSRTTASTTC